MTGRLRVASTWDGVAIPPDQHTLLEVIACTDGLAVALEAPLWGDPPPPLPPGPCPGLWEHEVAELFVGARGGRGYTELELGPHGHWLLLHLTDVRVVAGQGRITGLAVSLDGATEVGIEDATLQPGLSARPIRPRRRWRAVTTIPWHELPSAEPEALVANAYAIHGQGDARRYLAAHPLPGARPDFHQPASFRPLFTAR